MIVANIFMLPLLNIDAKIRQLSKPWSPIELARVNDHVVHLALFEGEYPKGFHTHEYDELFFVYKGEIIIQMRGQPDLRLREGELGVVPKGAEHCPKAIRPSYMLMFEPKAA